MKTQSHVLSILFGVLFAGLFILAGAYIVAISFDVIHVPPEGFHAPRIIAAAAGMVFFLGGLLVFIRIVAGDYGSQTLLFQRMQYLLVLLAMLAFSAVFLWAGFGSGARNIVQTSSFGSTSVSQAGDETSGRLIFGGAGVLFLFVTLAAGVFKWPKGSGG
jgi:hypothetical protein